MSIPTKGEAFAKLTEHLRLAQEDAAMLAHLNNADGGHMNGLIARGWLGVSELIKKIIYNVTELARRGLQ